MELSRKFSIVSLFLFALSSLPSQASFPVDVAYAPDTNLNLTVSAIKSAQHSILLNIYELTSPQIADALLGQIRAGVQVQILEEGQPVGGFSAASKGIESELAQAMRAAGKGDHLFVMTASSGASRRFHFDHGKYAVIDGNALLIGSENYSPTGNAVPGTLGNRGWEVVIHNPQIAQNFQAVFQSDAVTTHGDVVDMTGSAVMISEFQCDDLCLELDARKTMEPFSSSSLGDATFPADAVQRITSPDSSLSGLLGLINGARSSIDIELMTFDSAWPSGSNPLIGALEQAARRGVKIRVLLNDEAAFNNNGTGTVNLSSSKNIPTMKILNQFGSGIVAKIANIKGMGVDYIHNKGMLVDGNITLISSINWDANSIQNNREAAVAISSSAVHAYYEGLFTKDWQVSGGQ